MAFSLRDFVTSLRQQMYLEFPYFNGEYANNFGVMQTNEQKHPNRTEHIKDIAFMKNGVTYINDKLIVFEIGNEEAERKYPYYHILEDSPVIRKRERADKYTKGSQDKVKNKVKRDYSIISFNGKTYSKEYQKNVRGMRKSVIDKATYFTYNGKQRIRHQEESKNYINKHYHYLENMASKINPMLADMYGLEYKGVKTTGLKDEYIAQDYGIVSDYNEMLQISEMLGL